jgi:Response regulator containing a CheY-like receiver domain and an HTH DNA-binding domain
MSLVLSHSEIRAITRVARLLATPDRYSTVDGWRAAVNDALKELISGDTAGFLLPGLGRAAMYSQDHDPDQLERYPDIPVPDLADGTPIWDAIVRLEVGRLGAAYGRDYRQQYLHSAYYNEYAGANGAHDCVTMTTRIFAQTSQISVASLQLWHSSRRGRRFSDRDVEILRLLFPAFEVGVKAHMVLAGGNASLLKAIDALAGPAAMFEMSGREVHRTTSLSALLERDTAGKAAILAAVRAAVGVLLTACSSSGAAATTAFLGERILREVRTATDVYSVSAFITDQPTEDSRTMIIAMVEPLRPVADIETLSTQFGLTPAETRVARLLRDGKSNTDIAAALGASIHTIRRHTEAIFAKLEVRSRSEAAAKLRP